MGGYSSALRPSCKVALVSASQGVATLRRPLCGHVVAVPVPGSLLTGQLFGCTQLLKEASSVTTSGSSRSSSCSANGAVVVDDELGAVAALSSSSVPAAANAIASGLDEKHAGARVLLIGHSYGGYVGLEMARHHSARLAGLILISTQCRGDTPGAAARREQQVALARREGMDAMLDRIMPSLVSPNSLNDPSEKALIGTVKRMAEDVGVEAFARQMAACASRADHRETLRQLDPSIPVLVIAGGQDGLIPPRCARELKKLLADREVAAGGRDRVAPWRISTRPDCGHLVPLEKPDAFRQEVSSWAMDVSVWTKAQSEQQATSE